MCDNHEPDDAAQHYGDRGIVRGFSPDRSTIEIEHENIPGFMPSMTMPFSARDQKEIVDLKTGDAISFRMTVTEKDFWIDHVKKIPRRDVDIAEPKPPVCVPEGDRAFARRRRDAAFHPNESKRRAGYTKYISRTAVRSHVRLHALPDAEFLSRACRTTLRELQTANQRRQRRSAG